jgi:hypothetical protein
LRPHFGVAATSPPLSASAKLAGMVDKKQTINPAAHGWRDCRADLSTNSSATPHSALGKFRTRNALHSVMANTLIIRPHPAQSCLVKPTTAVNGLRSHSHQIKPNQTKILNSTSKGRAGRLPQTILQLARMEKKGNRRCACRTAYGEPVRVACGEPVEPPFRGPKRGPNRPNPQPQHIGNASKIRTSNGVTQHKKDEINIVDLRQIF